MKKTFATRITALSAALAVIAGSAASCGSNKSETKDQSKTSQQLMAASYRAELVDTDVELKNVSDMKSLMTDASSSQNMTMRKMLLHILSLMQSLLHLTRSK